MAAASEGVAKPNTPPGPVAAEFLSEKGPLFVMYPFDTQPALRTAVYFSRCIWQLKSIELP